MTSEIDKSEYPVIARKISDRMAARMAAAYEDCVARYLKEYSEPPDEDDFFAWLEGYDWAEPEEQR